MQRPPVRWDQCGGQLGSRAYLTLYARLSLTLCLALSVGFIGLGNMGAHMARNLLKAQLPVTVLDINAAAVESLQKAGATTAGACAPAPSPALLRGLC
jgi:D-arabinose 1-dehydrogenase-like Zn-dependent alcohol dehydrogenase